MTSTGTFASASSSSARSVSTNRKRQCAVSDLVAAFLSPSPLLVLGVALAGAPLALVLGWGRPRLAAWVACLSAGVALLAVTLAWRTGSSAIEVVVAAKTTTLLRRHPPIGEGPTMMRRPFPALVGAAFTREIRIVTTMLVRARVAARKKCQRSALFVSACLGSNSG